MTRRRLLVSLLPLFLASGAPAIVFHGQVRAGADKAPAPGILVQAEHHENRHQDHPDDFAVRVTTDESGRFSLEVPAAEGLEYAVLIMGADGHLYDGFTHLDGDKDLGTFELKRGSELTGKVGDKQGQPLPGVDVVAELRLRQYTCRHYVEAARTRTDAEGNFLFPDLSPGEYRCRVTSPDHAPAENTVVVTEEFSFLEFQLDQGCRIQGRVIGPAGQPLSDVAVRIGRKVVVKSDADGRFLLTGLKAGENKLNVESPDYALPLNRALPVKCAEGQPAACELKLVETGKLRIRLQAGGEGIPIPGIVRIRLTEPRDWIAGYRGLKASLTNGLAEAAGLAPGSYRLGVEGDGMAAMEADVTIASRETTDMEFTLPRVCTLYGSVMDPDGQPVKGAHVRLEEAGKGEAGQGGPRLSGAVVVNRESVSTDEKGQFALRNVAGGVYDLHVTEDRMTPLRRAVNVDPLKPETLALVMGRGLKLSGTILESDGSPVSKAEVHVNGPAGASGDEHIWKNVEADTNGVFEVSGLSTGKYDLSVRFGESNDPEVSLADVEAGTDDLLVTLGARHTVQGCVVDAAGKPLPGVAIGYDKKEGTSISRRMSDVETLKTDAEGRFKLVLRAGSEYRVRASLHPFLPATARVDLGAGKAEPTETLHLTMEAGCTIEGQVIRQKDGAPAAGLRVCVQSEANPWYFGFRESDDEPDNRTGADGRFRITGAPRGVVEVGVWSDGENPQVLATKMVQTAGAGVSGVTVEIGETGLVKGKVQSGEGQPLAGCHIMLFSVSRKTQATAQTSGDGTFELPAVPAGEYMLMWFSPGEGRSASARQGVTVRVGETVDLALGGRSGAEEKAALAGRIEKQGAGVGVGAITFIPLAPAGSAGGALSMVGGYREAEVDAGGAFKVEGVETGKYAFVYYSRPGKGEDDEAGPSRMYGGQVDVLPDQKVLVLKLAGLTVRGTVAGSDARPLDGAMVTLTPSGASGVARQVGVRWARSDAKGQYTIDCVEPGAYDFAVRHDDGSARRQGVELASGAGETADFQLARAFAVSGRLTDAAGGEAGNASVMAISGDTDETAGFAQVASDGEYKLEPGLAAGSYKLLAMKPGYAVAACEVEVEKDVVWNPVMVPGGAIEVRLTGKPGTEIANKVLHVKDATGAEVIRCRNAEWAVAPTAWRACAMVPTDAAGVSTIDGLPAGRYTVSVEGCPATAEAVVAALETTDVKLEL